MNFQDVVDDFCTLLKRRQIEGSLACAKRTAELMRALVTTQRHNDPQSLIDDVRSVGTTMQAAKPLELAIGNIVRRVLHVIREEWQQEDEEQQAGERPAVAEKERTPGLLSRAFRGPASLGMRTVSLHNLLDQGQALPSPGAAPPAGRPEADERRSSAERPPEAGPDAAEAKRRKGPAWKRKASIIEQLNELLDELDEIENNIALQAGEYIHANEVILTFGWSHTTLLFLQEAAKKRDFQVVVAEGAPSFGGQRMALELAQAGIQTTAIADSAIFAMMARVNKVLVGAHALLANGGVVAPVGTHLVALAAQRHSVPFVVLCGLHKLSPLFPHDPATTFNDFKSPEAIIDFDVLAETMGTGADTYCHVPNPTMDYVPPELIALFLTDTGGYTPSYVYRLLAEYYTREDYGLSKELVPAVSQ